MVRLLLAEMKNSQSTQELQSSTHVSHESHSEQPSDHTTDAPVTNFNSGSASSNDSRKISRKDVDQVQYLIESCLQLHMSKDEAVKFIMARAKIEPEFTALVWQKMEEQNADFFRAYYIRLKLKNQIYLFDNLIKHQYRLMKCPLPTKLPLAPIENGIHPMPVNNLRMGYPVLQQPSIPAAGQPHLDSMAGGITSCQVVNGASALSNFYPIWTNSWNGMVTDHIAPDMAPAIPLNSAMLSFPDMPVNLTSVASGGNFPFTTSEGMGTDACALDMAFTSDVISSKGPQLASDIGNGISRSLDQFQWNFSLCDITVDLPNLGDLGVLGNYPDSAFMQSNSDILLGCSNRKDIGNVDGFVVNSVLPGFHSDY